MEERGKGRKEGERKKWWAGGRSARAGMGMSRSVEESEVADRREGGRDCLGSGA